MDVDVCRQAKYIFQYWGNIIPKVKQILLSYIWLLHWNTIQEMVAKNTMDNMPPLQIDGFMDYLLHSQ